MARDVQRVADLRANPRPIDPDVVVPAAVKRAAEAAEAAHKATYGEQQVTPPPTPPPANPDGIVIADPPAPPPPAPTPPTPPQPTPQPVPPEVTPTPAPRQWDPEVELEMQRIRSAEGRKRADLVNQINAQNDRMAILEQTIQELRTAQPAAPTPPPAPTRLITEQEANEFGPEMLDVMGRRAKETISPELAELRSMMQSLEQKVTGTVSTIAKSAKQMMLDGLDRALPDWRQINLTPEFKQWLALQDPLFGVSRNSALQQAYAQNDTARVLAFFKGFVSELAATTPDQAVVDPPAPAPAKPSLETLAAPGRARTSAQPNAPAEKQIITTADIDAFYDAVRRGLYNGREAEKEALEQELFAAQREGRVRQIPRKG